MKQLLYFLLLVSFSGLLWSCEEDIAIEIPTGEAELVVQGHIEPEAPPFVILTRSLPVFAGTSVNEFAGSFVHEARVSVTVNGREYVLQEILLNNLSPEDQQIISEQFGIPVPLSLNSPTATIPVYTTADLKGKPGESYALQITAENQTLTAATSIPTSTPVDSLWFMPHPDVNNDSLVTLWYRYRDPDTLGNNVRYFTSRNGEPFYPGYQASVFTDEFVNGRSIDFPLERGYPKSAKVDLETYSYFKRGDTVQLKWAAVDYQHYQFWFTLEADRASNGNPFGFPTTVRSNIKNGLGIWGGYGVSRHTVVSK